MYAGQWTAVYGTDYYRSLTFGGYTNSELEDNFNGLGFWSTFKRISNDESVRFRDYAPTVAYAEARQIPVMRCADGEWCISDLLQPGFRLVRPIKGPTANALISSFHS